MNISDKVVCVDDSPLAKRPGHVAQSDFFLPNGLVSKGCIYVVEGRCQTGGIFIVGKPVLIPSLKRQIGWNTSRFRLLSEVQAEARSARERQTA